MRKRVPKPFTLLLFFFLLSNYLSATPDCPIITGRFQLADGTTSDASATGWYLNAANVASTGIFAVKSNRIHAQELGGVGIWNSRVFSTAGYSEFQVAVKVSSEGDMNSSEYVQIYYKINGGAETLLDTRTGNFGTIDFISPVLTGSNVQLVVKLYNYNNGGSQTSKYYIEEYRVFKDKGPCAVSTITATAAAANGGILTCTNSSLGLSATATGSGTTTWSWTGPNGFTSTLQNPSVTAAGTYTVVATNSTGTGSASVTVTENKTPPVITATGGALACGSCVSISATSNVSNASYSWSGPGNFTSNSQNPTVCSAGTYTVTVTNPANGCSAQQSVSVTAGTIATVWLEDFTGLSNGATSDAGTTQWTTTVTGSGTYSVQNNEYKVSFSGSQGVGVWTSQAIDISSRSNVSFSVDLRSEVGSTNDALETTDYIRVYYKLNGGAETLVYEDLAGIGNTTNTTGSITVNSATLAGSTLQVIIKTSNSDPTERYFFDNIKVTGSNAGSVTITPSVNGTVTCIATAQLSATATGTVTAWSWTGPNGFTSAAQNPVVNAGGQYIVTATLSSGCAASATITVPENKTPPDITATGGTLACLSTVTLNVNSTVTGATYSWTGPNNFSSTSKNPTVSAAGTYTATVTNPANGCTASQSVTVSSGSTAPAIFWNEDFAGLSNGTTSDAGTTAWTTSTSGAGTYSVQNNEFKTSFNAQAEGVWSSQEINIAGKSNVTFSVDLRSEVTSSSDAFETLDYIRVYYKLNGGAETLVYEDLAGIGNTTNTTASITVNSAALNGSTRQVTIKTNNSGPTEKYFFDNIKVTGSDIIGESVTATGGALTCTSSSVTLLGNAASGGVSYSWTGPNNFTSTAQNPVVTATGIYTLTVHNPATGCNGTDTALVVLNTTPPGASASASGSLSCNASSSVTLSGSSSTSGVTYSWTGPNNFTSTAQNPVVTVAGTYNLTVTNTATGCTSTASTTVTMSSTSTGIAWSENFTLPNGTTSGTGTSSWSIATNPSTTLFSVLNNEIRISNSSTTGEGVWTSGPIDITGKTNISISAGVRSSIINNAVMNNDATYGDYIRFYYKLDNGTEVKFAEKTAIINNHSTTPTAVSVAGLSGASSLRIVVRARATGNDEFYYFDNVQVVATSQSALNAVATATDILSCTKNSVGLTGSTSATSPVNYSWTGPGNFTSTVQNPSVTAAGTYTLTVTDQSTGCTGSDTALVSLNTTPPGATASASGSLSCSAGSSVTLSGSSSSTGVTYSWTGPNNFTSADQNPVVTVAGTYNLTVTSTATGCTSTASATVTMSTSSTSTLWLENFTMANGTTSDAGATSWSITTNPSTMQFAVLNNEMRSTNSTTQGEGVWTSGVINIAGKTNVTISAGVRSSVINGVLMNNSGELADYLRFYYKLNNGAEVLFDERMGIINNHSTTPTTISVAGLSGTSLQIVVRTRATANDEFYYFDNVQVVATSSTSLNAIATATDILSCTKSNVPLTGSSSATTPVNYSWTGPGNFTSPLQNPTATTAGIYTLTVTDQSTGCTGSDTALVSLNNTPPGATASASGSLSCSSGSSVTLSGSSPTSNVSYSWTGPNNFTSPAQNPVVTTAGTYNLTVTNPVNGCTSTASAIVTTNNSTTSTWLEDFTLANGTTSDAGATAWTTSKTVSAAVIAVQNNELRITNCTSTGDVVWTSGTFDMTGKTNISISAGVKSSIINNAVMNTDPTYGDYIRFYYKLNNGTEVLFAEKTAGINNHSTTLSPVSVTIPTGNYNTMQVVVRARATGNDEFYYVDNMQVVATGTANITANATGGAINCINNSATLQGSSSTSGVSYTWSGPNGYTSTAQNPVVFEPGTYNLTVALGGCTGTAAATVSIDTTKPNITASATPVHLTCTATPAVLTGGSSTPGVSYSWSSAAGVIANTASTSVVDPGTYTFKVYNPANGCTGVKSVIVTQNITPPPAITASHVGTVTCNTPNATISGTISTPGLIYSWSGPNGFTSNALTTSVIKGGTYTLTAADPDNGCTTSASTIVDENTGAPTGLSITNPGRVTCLNRTIKITGFSAAPNATYTWTGPNGFTSSLTSINVTKGGSYTFTVKDTINGCSTGLGTTVIDNTIPPVVTIVNTSPLSCSNTRVTLSANTNVQGVGYLWLGPDDFYDVVATTTTNIPGSYSVIVNDPSTGCTTTELTEVTGDLSECERKATNTGNTATATAQNTLAPSEAVTMLTYKAYPNPVTSNSVIEFVSPQNTTVTVSMYNTLGVCAKVLFKGNAAARQRYRLAVPASQLQAGAYYYTINAGGKIYSGRLVIVK
ncbi:MAG TPA: T9SS type A sorting domain-containing protein [Niastella sp.]